MALDAKDASLPCTHQRSLEDDSPPSTSQQSPEDATDQQGQGKRLSRKNTVEEKRHMRRKRKSRLRKCKAIKRAKLDLEKEKVLKEKAQEDSAKYRAMSRTFWERWRWELQKRKEAMIREMQAQRYRTKEVTEVKFQHIDPDMLLDPVIDGVRTEVFAGRGSFGVVRMQLFRGITVAVKEFLPRTVCEDVIHEASILASLCHPNLPLLFGVCLTPKPFRRIVMQFHSYALNKSMTMQQLLYQDKRPITNVRWILLCGQLLEAISYLHNEKNILHNDIKLDNILIARCLSSSQDNCQNVVVVDFGKATYIKNAKRYHLTEFEKREYIRKFPHIAPEVIEGETKTSVAGDMFAAGLVVQKMSDKNCFSTLSKANQKKINDFAESCRLVNYYLRPKSDQGLKILEEITTNCV